MVLITVGAKMVVIRGGAKMMVIRGKGVGHQERGRT